MLMASLFKKKSFTEYETPGNGTTPRAVHILDSDFIVWQQLYPVMKSAGQ